MVSSFIIWWHIIITVLVVYMLYRDRKSVTNYAGDQVIQKSLDYGEMKWILDDPEYIKLLVGNLNKYQLNSTGKVDSGN